MADNESYVDTSEFERRLAEDNFRKSRRTATIVMAAGLVLMMVALPFAYSETKEMGRAQRQEAQLEEDCADAGSSCSYGEFLRQKDSIDAEGERTEALGAIMLAAMAFTAALGGYGIRSGVLHPRGPKGGDAQ